jgi:hypothetical protein
VSAAELERIRRGGAEYTRLGAEHRATLNASHETKLDPGGQPEFRRRLLIEPHPPGSIY